MAEGSVGEDTLSARETARYDAFLSYSHAADDKLAPAVQSGLQRLARPWYRPRALRVFRDKTSLAATPQLWERIEAALVGSKYFILMASPEAAASLWVQREIEAWLAAGRADRLLIALTDGACVWEATSGDFDRVKSTALPPSMIGVFGEEPLYVDLRWARSETDLSLRQGRFRSAIADLAAPIHGKPRDELEGEDVRQHRRTLRLVRVTLVTLLALALAATTFAIRSEREQTRAEREAKRATRQATLATARRVATQAELVRGEPDLALLLHLAALEIADIRETRHALIRTLAGTPIEAYGRLERGSFNSATAPPAMSGGGERVAFASTDGDIRLWDVTADTFVAEGVLTQAEGPKGDEWRIRSDEPGPGETPIPAIGLAVTPDGSTVAVKPLGGPVLVWSPEGLAALDTRECINATGAPLAASDMGWLACGAEPEIGRGVVELWDESRARVASVDLARPIHRMVFGPGGGPLAIALETNLMQEKEGAITLLRFPDSSPVSLRFPGPEPDIAESLAFSPDGRLLAAGTFRGSVAVWDAKRGRVLATLSGHSSQVTAVAFAQGGSRLFSGDAGGQVVAWDLRDFGGTTDESELVARFEAHASTVHAIHAIDQSSLVTVGDDAVGAWDLSRSQLRRPLPGGEKEALDVVVAGDVLVSTATAGRFRTWNLAGEGAEDLLHGPDQSGVLFALAAAANGRLAAARLPGGVELWDVTADNLVDSIAAETVTDVATDADGGLVVAAELNRGLIVWRPDADVGGVQRIEDRLVAFPVALTRDSRRMAYAAGSILHVRDPLDESDGRTLGGFGGGVSKLDFSPDGTLLAVGMLSGDVELYDVDRLERRHIFQDPTGQVRALAFDREGAILAVGTLDGVIHLFDSTSGERLAELGDRHPLRTVWGLVFAPDGRLFAATEHGVVVWDLRVAAMSAGACRLAGRDLTSAEWERYIPDRPYGALCPKS